MYVSNFFKSFFDGFSQIQNYKDNDKKTNAIAVGKIFSYIIVGIPVAVVAALAYGAESLYDRIHVKEKLTPQDKAINQQVKATFPSIDISEEYRAKIKEEGVKKTITLLRDSPSSKEVIRYDNKLIYLDGKKNPVYIVSLKIDPLPEKAEDYVIQFKSPFDDKIHRQLTLVLRSDDFKTDPIHTIDVLRREENEWREKHEIESNALLFFKEQLSNPSNEDTELKDLAADFVSVKKLNPFVLNYINDSLNEFTSNPDRFIAKLEKENDLDSEENGYHIYAHKVIEFFDRESPNLRENINLQIVDYSALEEKAAAFIKEHCKDFANEINKTALDNIKKTINDQEFKKNPVAFLQENFDEKSLGNTAVYFIPYAFFMSELPVYLWEIQS